MSGTQTTGREVLRRLERAIRESRQRAEAVSADLDKLDRFIEDVLDRRGDSLVELAKHYMPDMNSETIERQYKEVRVHLQRLLQEKQKHERDLQRDWEQNLDRRGSMESKIDELTTKLDGLATERDELEEQLTKLLKDNDEFQEKSRLALAAENELKRNELRIAEMKEEVAEKLPAYEKSKLFQYLHKRGFGTAEYKSRGLTRQLDRWVAKLVNYNDNRQGYEFLRKTPELMAAEVERRRGEFDTLMERLEAIEDQLSDEIGLSAILKRGSQAVKERRRKIAELHQMEDERQRIEHQIANLEQHENEYYEQGVERLKKFLSNMEESALAIRTRATPETVDDAIFSEIKLSNRQLREARQQSHEDREKLEVWHEKISGLDRVARQFRSNNFDSRRSFFSRKLDLGREIDRYLEGNNTSKGLWNTIRRNQKFVRPRNDSWDHSWDDMGDVLDSDMSRVLGRVLIEVAGEAMRQAANRSMHRRGPKRRGRYRGF